MLLKFVALTANHLVNNGRAWCLVSKIGEKKTTSGDHQHGMVASSDIVPPEEGAFIFDYIMSQ